MKNNALKLISLALVLPMMTACPKPKKPVVVVPDWEDEILEEMELYMGTTLPYLELDEDTMYHGYDDSSESYGYGCYVIGDDNEENLIEDYGDLLVEDGWTFVPSDEGDSYTLVVNDFELTCVFDYYEATDEYAAGNEIAVYCPIYVAPVTEEALLEAGYTKVQGWPSLDVAEVLTDAYNIGAINATGEWYVAGPALIESIYGDYYGLYLATHADVTEATNTNLLDNGYYWDDEYQAYYSTDDEVEIDVGLNNGFTLINIYGPILQPEEGEVASEAENGDGTITVTYTFVGNLIDQTSYAGRTFESTSANLTVAKGESKSDPTYYENGTALRCYYKNTLTLQAASGYEILSATVSVGSVKNLTVNDFSASSGTVTANGTSAPTTVSFAGVNASSLTITVGPNASKGNIGITSIAVVVTSVR